MRYSAISLAGIVLVGGSALLACSSPDPGVGDLGPRPHGLTAGEVPTSADAGKGNSTTDSGGGTGPGTGGGDGGGGGGGGNHDGGGGGGGSGDGGGEGGAQAASPFKGLPTYASKPVATSARTSHANNGQGAQQPGEQCLGCHGGGNAAIATFLAVGWVATAANGTTGAADVEVSVYAAGAGAAFSAHTDADGFFWVNPPAGGATGPYTVGARNGTTELDMPSHPASLECTSCHGNANPGPIHLP